MSEGSMKAVGWAHSFPMSGGVKAGRQWARKHLETLTWTHEVPETVDAVVLTVSELITNAHIHAHSGAQVTMTWDSRCLHVSVHDADSGEPASPSPDVERTSGRGLLLVDALADRWETRRQAEGKTVTACFCPPGSSDPHQAEGLGPSRPRPPRAD